MSRHKQWITKLLIFQVCSTVMSDDNSVMSDDSIKIEDRIFRQKWKVKFAQWWWNSSLQVIISNYQLSKKILKQKLKNSSRKIFLYIMLVMSDDDVQTCIFLGISNGSIYIKYTFNSSFSLCWTLRGKIIFSYGHN